GGGKPPIVDRPPPVTRDYVPYNPRIPNPQPEYYPYNPLQPGIVPAAVGSQAKAGLAICVTLIAIGVGIMVWPEEVPQPGPNSQPTPMPTPTEGPKEKVVLMGSGVNTAEIIAVSAAHPTADLYLVEYSGNGNDSLLEQILAILPIPGRVLGKNLFVKNEKNYTDVPQHSVQYMYTFYANMNLARMLPTYTDYLLAQGGTGTYFIPDDQSFIDATEGFDKKGINYQTFRNLPLEDVRNLLGFPMPPSQENIGHWFTIVVRR
ncbi:MAG: hypothetical protein H0T53_11015, partial [Herpetosiphonaceae bacterium]|nr:hypothetical protein [Herpetosiphonaceae bacterium]